MPLLPIKFRKQSQRMYCYVACLKMVIDYSIDELGVDQRRLRESTIAKTTGTHPDAGTIPGNIERINDKLNNSFPQMQFRDNIGGEFSDIIEDIDNKIPVIAWVVVARDEGNIIFHSIVINGYSEDRTRIFYIDPELTHEHFQKEIEVGDFISNKLTSEGHLVRLNLTERGEKDLMGGIHPIGRRKRRRRRIS